MKSHLGSRRQFLWSGIQLVSVFAAGCASANGGSGVASAGAAGATGGRSGSGGSGGGSGGSLAYGGSGGARPGAAGSCRITRDDIQGPFFTPNSPERMDLRESGQAGELLLVRGRVLDPSCSPIEGAVLDFWQADDDGAYDNQGFQLRGHQRTNADGRFELRTIVPGHYLNGRQFRPAHLHVKVLVGSTERLTTQLYFENDPYNEIDPWFSEETMLRQRREGGELVADFDFSVRV